MWVAASVITTERTYRVSSPDEVAEERARALRQQYAATANYDLAQRLNSVRCPIHDEPLTRVAIVNGQPDIDGCCGAMVEAGRVLQTL